MLPPGCSILPLVKMKLKVFAQQMPCLFDRQGLRRDAHFVNGVCSAGAIRKGGIETPRAHGRERCQWLRRFFAHSEAFAGPPSFFVEDECELLNELLSLVHHLLGEGFGTIRTMG
jgi:hypothetical protein